MDVPRIDRSISLNFMGDWGRANLHRALGWLCSELVYISGKHTDVAIHNGTAAVRNLLAVGRGQVDVALVTPEAFARMALDGVGPFAGERFPHLRSLGHIPQHDRMILAVRKELGITSFEDLRRKKTPLRIAIGHDDGDSFMGLAALKIMEKSGIPRAELEKWGGFYIEREAPRDCVDEILKGNTNAIFQEAIMTQYWHTMTDKIDFNFIEIEPRTRDTLKQELGWPTGTLPKGYMRGMDREMEFLDFSHFLLVTTTDLPDDIAYAMSWALIEKWSGLEDQYRHIKPERSPVSYPIDPKLACRSPIPLHPGAERYFRKAGHL